MAFKVKIVGIVLFMCLIDTLHSASYGRVKREDDKDDKPDPEKLEKQEPEKIDKPEKKPEPTDDKDSEKNPSKDKPKPETDKDKDKNKDKNPFDVNSVIDNVSQIFNVNTSPDWMKEANNWFKNIQGLFGGH